MTLKTKEKQDRGTGLRSVRLRQTSLAADSKPLTHLQVLVEQSHVDEVLQNIVLLPAAEIIVRILFPSPPVKPVTQKPVDMESRTPLHC